MPSAPLPELPFRIETTADGSQTFFSEDFGQLFHSHFGARQEAEAKFVRITRLAERAATRSQLTILDICYGLGYNTAAALTAIWQANPDCRVRWHGLESDLRVTRAAIDAGLMEPWPQAVQQAIGELAETQQVNGEQFQAVLHVGDARRTIAAVLASGVRADAIFLDPFAPPDCPQLWSVDFLGRLARCLAEDGYLATYSCAAAVRAALVAAGLAIGSTPPVGRNTHGTAARWCEAGLTPLDRRAREHLLTRAAVPYRDPSGTDTAAAIVQRRHREQQASPLEPTTRWKKRWRGIRE
ncbi:MAG: tRNA (5-methylaminomethyl-2-thiouridine)(34)-methyltransferase MnmD [Geitlerinemataceae cyanobacterium]